MTKSRQNFHLDHDITEQLGRLAKKPGVTKSAIVADALRVHFARRGGDDTDEKLQARFNKFAGQLGRIERRQLIHIETLANFIRFYFSVVPPLAAADQAAVKALAEERFAAFIDQVGRRRASGNGVAERLTHEAEI